MLTPPMWTGPGIVAATAVGPPAPLGFNEVLIRVLVIAALLASLPGLNWLLLVRPELSRAQATRRRLVMLGCTGAAVIASVLTLPIDMASRLGILQLLALAATALITLSSTTIAANFMAGLMLGRVRSFRPGDFIRVGEQFGRVSDRGLFHVEIQTEDRDLVTLPNAYLINTPVRVVRQSGTIVSCELSLGYDAAQSTVRPLLVEAAERAGLAEPYTQILALNDFSVSYRVCGFLEDVKTLITARSTLRASVLDTLHGAGVEIVSPSFMNQRPLEGAVIPEAAREAREESSAPEAIAFDKAEEAEALGKARADLEALRARLKSMQGERPGDGPEREAHDAEVAAAEREIEALETRIRSMESGEDGSEEA